MLSFFSVGNMSLDRLLEVRNCIFSEAFHKIEQEVKAVVIYFLKMDFELALIALSYLLFHEFHLFQSFASQIAEAMKDIIAAGWLDLKSYLPC